MTRPGSARQALTRRRGACESCKSRKVRCNGARPCDQCHRLARECIYRQTQHTRHRSQSSQNGSLSDQGDQFHVTAQPLLSSTSPLPNSFDSQDLFTELFWNPSQIHDPNSIESSLNDPTNLIPSNNLNEDETDNIQSSPTYITEDFCSWTAPSSTSAFNELRYSSPEGVNTHRIEPDPINAERTLAVGALGSSNAITDPRPNPSLGPAFTLPIHTDGKTLKLNFMLEASTSLQQLSPRQYEPNPEAEETRTIMALPLHARIYLDGLVEICYKDPTGLALFLSFNHLKEMLAPALEDRSPSAEQTAIVYSAIAIGSHLRDLEMGRKEDSSSAFFRRSLNNLSEVFMAKDSLRKLQSLVSMLVYARDFELRCFTTLMNNAIWCAQNLRLGQMSGITSLTSDVKEQAWAMRMFWYLYGLAQPYCLRWGIQQTFDEDAIDIDLPESPSLDEKNHPDHPDYLAVQVKLAKVCSQIRRSLVYPAPTIRTLISPDAVTEFLKQQLEACGAHIQESLWECEIPPVAEFYQRRGYLQLRLHYLETLLALESHWISTKTTLPSTLNPQQRQKCKQCIHTARMILEEYSNIFSHDILGYRPLMVPLLVAVKIIFWAITLRWAEGEELSYLAIACGIFGRLSMGFEVPLAEVIELNQIAQRVHAENQPSDSICL